MSVKIEKETDGVLTTHVPTIDFTDPHPGDIAAMKQMVLDCAPEALLQNLEAFADAADISNPLVAIRIDKLLERIAYARRMSIDGSYDPALIDRANDVRREILALPLAVIGIAVMTGKVNAQKERALKYQAEKKIWCDTEKSILATRNRRPSDRELARLVAEKLNPSLTKEEIKKMADSRRRWLIIS